MPKLVCRSLFHHTRVTAAQNYTSAKIQDGGDRHFMFRFFITSQSAMKILASNLACRDLLAKQVLLWPNSPLLAQFKIAVAEMLDLDFRPYLGHQCRYLHQIWKTDRYWPMVIQGYHCPTSHFWRNSRWRRPPSWI